MKDRATFFGSRAQNVDQIRLSSKNGSRDENIGEMFPTIQVENMAIINGDKASTRPHSVEQKWPSPSGTVSGKNIFLAFLSHFLSDGRQA
jgi:hypothetical protein